MSFEVVNPATGEKGKSYDALSPEQAAQVVEEVHQAFLEWRDITMEQRSFLMRGAADVLRSKKDQWVNLMTAEMGKPISQGQGEIEKCAKVCEFYAEHAETFLENQDIDTEARRSYVNFQPLGVVLAVMPWNFPFWQVFRFLAPALMAGNTGILKHASNVPGCAEAIQQIMEEAGFPKNVFRNVMIGSQQVADVIKHPHVKAVTLTGSTPAGKAVASTAGSVLKKTVLELGGSDPYIILDDADVEKAAELCAASRLINAGQSCIAAKRFIVTEKVRGKFIELFTEKLKSKKVGDPTRTDTEVGPMARHDLRDELHAQVQKSIEQGARCVLGGEIPEGPGAFYPPTVLTGVKEGVLAYSEELFGPVASIIDAKDENDAVRIANDSVFGLGAAIFTKDVDKGESIAASKLEAGACFVNEFVRSDPRMPFGGIKESGYGRELSSFGIREFVNIKTVYVA